MTYGPWLIEAVRASAAAYDFTTHARANSEGLLWPTRRAQPLVDAPIFAVRGTTFDRWNILSGDALLDGLAVPWRAKRYPELGWCHKGFLRGKWWGEYRGALGLWEACRAELIEQRPLLLCGHSKGGAEASILAALLVLAGHTPAALITFGAPRCAASTHLNHILRSIITQFHVRQGVDIVPRSPAAPWWQNWEHQMHLHGGMGLAPSDCFSDHKIAAYGRVVERQFE